MTPKEIDDIRSWQRGEWCADITEIESMVYGLLDELDRISSAAETMRRGLAGGLADVPNPRNPDAAQAIRFVLTRGHEIGLFKTLSPEATTTTEPGGHG